MNFKIDIPNTIIAALIFIIAQIAQFAYFTASTEKDIEYLQNTKADKLTTVVLTQKVEYISRTLEDIRDLLEKDPFSVDRVYRSNNIAKMDKTKNKIEENN